MRCAVQRRGRASGPRGEGQLQASSFARRPASCALCRVWELPSCRRRRRALSWRRRRFEVRIRTSKICGSDALTPPASRPPYRLKGCRTFGCPRARAGGRAGGRANHGVRLSRRPLVASVQNGRHGSRLGVQTNSICGGRLACRARDTRYERRLHRCRRRESLLMLLRTRRAHTLRLANELKRVA